MSDDFHAIRRARNLYLHNWTTDQSAVTERAVECYAGAIRLFESTMSITFDAGMVRLPDSLMEYLRVRGGIEDDRREDE